MWFFSLSGLCSLMGEICNIPSTFLHAACCQWKEQYCWGVPHNLLGTNCKLWLRTKPLHEERFYGCFHGPWWSHLPLWKRTPQRYARHWGKAFTSRKSHCLWGHHQTLALLPKLPNRGKMRLAVQWALLYFYLPGAKGVKAHCIIWQEGAYSVCNLTYMWIPKLGNCQ